MKRSSRCRLLDSVNHQRTDCTVGSVAGQLAACRATGSGFDSRTEQLCVIHKLLIRVWVTCVCELVQT
uniref:SFRICE_008501 n=1 Tax=Spodoptera frugiperda TaxID=7108 RepID=A0A2H1WNL6_SPOFR